MRARWRGCAIAPHRFVARRLVGALTAIAIPAILLLAAGCRREDRTVVARVDGDPILFADFEAFVRTEAGDDWMGLEEEVLQKLWQQFLDELLLACVARDDGFAPESADRVSALAALREGAGAPPVSDEDVRLYMEAHPEELRRPERLVLGQLLLPDRPTADEAWRAIRTRRDFDAVAREMSDRPGVVYGGYTEDVARDDLPPAFRDALFALQSGEVSGVLGADYGYHVFHVREHRPEEVLPVSEAAEAIADRLEREHADQRIGDMLAGARERYPVEVLDWNLPFLLDVGVSSP